MKHLLDRIRTWLARHELQMYQHLDDFDWEEGDN